MEDTRHSDRPTLVKERPERQRRRWAEHVIGVVISALLVLVVRNLGHWDLLPFLTDDYARVIDPITLSVVVTGVGHLLQLAVPGRGFRVLAEGVGAAFAFYAALRIFQVFPFAFETGGRQWELAARGMLIFILAATAMAALVASLRLLTSGD